LGTYIHYFFKISDFLERFTGKTNKAYKDKLYKAKIIKTKDGYKDETNNGKIGKDRIGTGFY